jgi:hypothetical protein
MKVTPTMRQRPRFSAALLTGLLLMAVPAMAQEGEVTDPASPQIGTPTAGAETGTLTLILENDLFYNIDRHYTNGVQAVWTTARDGVPDWTKDWAQLVPFFAQDGHLRAVFALGQNMYTPSDIKIADPPQTDRPYAGWLHGSVGLINENNKRMDQLQLTLGVVGPASLAEPAQKFIHKLIDSPKPLGWDTQLHNEPGLVLTYQRSWRHDLIGGDGFGIDMMPHVGGALGNVSTYADTGLMFRAGWRLPADFGPARIQPSLPGSGFFEPDAAHPIGWYFFLGASGRGVARNIFLDGNTFRDSRSVDRKFWVGDLQAGVAINIYDVRLTYTHVFRTREFTTQDKGDQYGAVALTWQW